MNLCDRTKDSALSKISSKSNSNLKLNDHLKYQKSDPNSSVLNIYCLSLLSRPKIWYIIGPQKTDINPSNTAPVHRTQSALPSIS